MDQKNLKKLRQAAGLTQIELSQKLGVSSSQIQKLEYGKIKLENITAKNFMALARALNVKPEDLL